MTEELKPCAHCGSTQFTQEWHNNLDSYIECLDCGASACPIAWNRRASPWVSVEDGLPDDNMDVFVQMFYDKRDLVKAHYSKIDNAFYLYHGGVRMMPDRFTHWMPIPPLPEIER